MSIDPKVSVIMSVYNGEKYVKEAIESVLAQSFEGFEFIIIDDGSTDSSVAIVNSYDDKRIRFLKNDKNRGLAYSLNRGIDEAKGNYIARMDSDDICLKNRLELQYNFMEAHLDIGISGAAVKVFGNEVRPLQYPSDPDELKILLLYHSPLIHPTVIFRTDILRQNKNLRYQEEPPTAEDYDMWEKASHVVKIANLSEFVLLYRVDHEIKIPKYLSEQNQGNLDVKKRILHKLLSKEVSDQELQTHIDFSKISTISDLDELKNIMKWATTLLESNSSQRIYNEFLFEYQVIERAYIILTQSECVKFRKLQWFTQLPIKRKRATKYAFAFKLLLKLILNKKISQQ
jgi:glycosyltransferase involved in cell wall biosynthesis